jgi:hypothetical protein
MLSPRRSRAFLVFPVLLFVSLWYYYDFKLVTFQVPESQHVETEHRQPDEEPSAASTTLGLAIEPHLSIPTTSERLPSQTTPPATAVEPTQTSGGVSVSPDLSTSPSDVLLIFKTGASTFWRRMPLHLVTTLANGRVPNSAIYSDLNERLADDFESIDVLENVSGLIKTHDPTAHESYLELQSPDHINTYREHGQLPGDEPAPKPGNTPGWLLDKYKFLPMFTHAQRHWPDVRRTIYVEDDTFLFWDNILRWLSTLSPDAEPSYYGAIAGEGNETFAQGGSGMVFSRSLMRSVFGGDAPPDLAEYGNYTSKACCGDTVFGKVLRDHGIFVNKGEYGPVSFRPEPPWRTGFDEIIWCAPVFTFHHLHHRDLMQLAEVERVQRESSTPSVCSLVLIPKFMLIFSQRPTIFRDIFTTLILPHLTSDTRTNWDNYASRFILTANSTSGFHPTFQPANSTAFAQASQSPAACRDACKSFDECLSWRHETATETCALETFLRLGREVDPQPDWEPKTEIVSGWVLDKMDERLLTEVCDVVKDPNLR